MSSTYIRPVGGGHFGYVTNLALFPNADLVVALLTNSGVTGLPRRATFHMADEILGLPKTKAWLPDVAIDTTKQAYAVTNETVTGTFPEHVPNKPPTHELSAYAGEYNHPGLGIAAVRLEGGKLHIAFDALTGVLTHYHYDSFTTVFQHPGLKMGQLVAFNTGSDGKISGATFAVMDDMFNFEKIK